MNSMYENAKTKIIGHKEEKIWKRHKINQLCTNSWLVHIASSFCSCSMGTKSGNIFAKASPTSPLLKLKTHAQFHRGVPLGNIIEGLQVIWWKEDVVGIKVTVAGALWLVKHQLITLLALNYIISPHLASPVGSVTLSKTRYIMKPMLPQANEYKQEWTSYGISWTL